METASRQQSGTWLPARSANRAASLAAVRTKIRFVTVDLSDSSATADLFGDFKPEKVFHMAAHPDRAESFQQMRDCLRHNTEAVINLLEISQEAGVETFVFCDSTKAVWSGSFFGMPWAKTCRASGWPLGLTG